jgi:branched-chain amino acid transport system permease protein
MLTTLSNFFLNWIVFSALYALTAIGFTIIFGVGGVLNLAHGASITIGAFLTLSWHGSVAGSLPDTAALLLVVAAGLAVVAVFNLLLYLVFVRGLERVYDTAEQVSLTVMVVTLIGALFVEETARLWFGSQARSVPNFIGGVVPGTNVEMNLLVGFVVSWLVIGGLFLFLDRSKLGKALVAASMNRRGAEIVGVNIRRLYVVTWVIAGVLAGVAGVFLGSFQGASPTMGRSPLVISFAIVVLGGLGSVKGSVIAAYVIGLLEIGTTTFIDPSATGLTAFLVIVLVLLVRPEGLYGRELQVGDR